MVLCRLRSCRSDSSNFDQDFVDHDHGDLDLVRAQAALEIDGKEGMCQAELGSYIYTAEDVLCRIVRFKWAKVSWLGNREEIVTKLCTSEI